jgi:hypothetical protein
MPLNVKSSPDRDRQAEAFIAKAMPAPAAPSPPPEYGKAIVNMRFDAGILARIDAAARRQGISRTAWLHVAASKALDADSLRMDVR